MENKTKTYYRIPKHIQNTGSIKIRLSKRYITINFNTTFPTEYSQEYLKRLYQNKEAKPYIEEFTSDLPLEQIIKTEYYKNLPNNVVLITSSESNDDSNSDNSVIEIYINKEDVLETKKLEDMSLSELRKLYPNIKSNSKSLFIKKIEEQNG